MGEKLKQISSPEIEAPETESEVPFSDRSSIEPAKASPTTKIDAKDSRAFWLTCGCVIILTIFGLIDALLDRDIIKDSQMLESFFEIIKYIITTSLGFFFATTVSRKE